MPSVMPDGTYSPSLLTLLGTKEERNTCPHWQHMGCLMDATEKICEGGKKTTVFFRNFSYVCPKPVLVNVRFVA